MAETTETKAVPEAEKNKEQSLPFYQLFTFADKYDYLLMISGSLGAIIHGSSMPVFFLLFGEMVNGFGKNQSDLTKMTHEVAKVHFFFPYFHQKYIKTKTCSVLFLPTFFMFLDLRSVNIFVVVLMQYALYFVYLGLIVCLSSYAGIFLFLFSYCFLGLIVKAFFF